jgi:hypothetical protein
MPGWTVPCISPYVTKVIYYMRMADIAFEAKPQNLAELDRDTPHGNSLSSSTPTAPGSPTRVQSSSISR